MFLSVFVGHRTVNILGLSQVVTEHRVNLTVSWRSVRVCGGGLRSREGRAADVLELGVGGYFSRNLNRWIFPVAVFGSSSTNSIQRGYL
jgi:hypothetical protein